MTETHHNVSDQAVQGNVHYVNDHVRAVSEEKAAAGDRDVMMHGASSVRALLELGLVDELAITISPLLLTSGRRLFDDGGEQRPLNIVRTQVGHNAVHLRYEVAREAERLGRRRWSWAGPLARYPRGSFAQEPVRSRFDPTGYAAALTREHGRTGS